MAGLAIKQAIPELQLKVLILYRLPYCQDLLPELLYNVSFDWTRIVKKITITTKDNKLIIVHGKDFPWSLIPQYPACQSVDLNDHFNFKMEVLYHVTFVMYKSPNLSIQLKIEDERKSLTRRTLESQNFDYDGIPLEIENLTSPIFYDFTLALFETIHLESDSGQNCKNYPSEKFSNYRQCDMDFVYNEMKNKYKIMPFWAAKTLDEVTNLT